MTKNAEVVAGTGEQCLPFDEARCGDGGKAIEATLMSPKGTGIYQFEDFFLLKKIYIYIQKTQLVPDGV